MSPFLLLYQDAIEHCRQFLEIRGIAQKSAEQFHGILRRSVQSAYREVMGRRTWRYCQRLGQINIVAPYSTGTVVYDHTGGTYERQLTLTNGVWPSWALYGKVRIDEVNYTVEDRKSDTVLTLDPQLNPGADVASTSYDLFRSSYTLPADFSKLGTPQPENWGHACYVSPDEFLFYQRHDYATGDPTAYTLARDESLHGAMAVMVWPVPSTAQTWQFPYHSRGREMKYSGYDEEFAKGRITTTEDSTTVTGKGTAFSEDMIGSILRIGDNVQDPPTGIDGQHPRVDERTIVAVASTTSLTVDAGVNSSQSEVKYTVSDVVDIEPGMVNLFLRCCEKHLAINFDLKGIKQIHELYENAYTLASEEDSRILQHRSPNNLQPWINNYTVTSE
jgi:hypothetical protein